MDHYCRSRVLYLAMRYNPSFKVMNQMKYGGGCLPQAPTEIFDYSNTITHPHKRRGLSYFQNLVLNQIIETISPLFDDSEIVMLEAAIDNDCERVLLQ